MRLLLASLISCFPALCIFSQVPRSETSYDQITAAYQQGRLDEAERRLRTLLQAHPAELRALSLMGVVLDGQKRYAEAESYYLQAVKLAPDSAGLQNNLGNHYVAQGNLEKAKHAFLRALTIDPRHANANLQLAQINIQKKEYAAALDRLDHLPSEERASPSVQLLRIRALFGVGRKEEAQELLEHVESQAAADLGLAFALGMTYVEMERFADAETTFTRLLQADPTNFEVLYNLGTAALRAGHLERAQAVYQRALEQRPGDIDSIVGLARVLANSRKEVTALPLLVQANKAAPDRNDILLLIAQTTYRLGLYVDTAAAYDKYLKLKPDDDRARLERGHALSRTYRIKEGIQELEWYVQKHPKDMWGHYRLAVALSVEDKSRALDEINKALELDPKFWEARYAHGVLSQRVGMNQEAVEDLQAYLDHDPANVQAHEELARAYLGNKQPQSAAEILKKAIALAPDRSSLYFQYSRALRALGRVQEMNEAVAKFKELGGAKTNTAPRAGVLDFLSLSPSEQQAQYVANLKTSVLQRPSDPELKLRLIEVYLAQGKTDDARPLLDEIKRMQPETRVLAQCGRLLVDYSLYQEAIPFIESAIQQGTPADRTYLDLTLAVLHTAGAEKALKTLDSIPPSKRSGDYYLLAAQIFDSLGKLPEAVKALNEAFRAAPTRQDLYVQACSFLMKHRKFEECLQLINQSEKYVPDSPELMLARAIALEMLNRTFDASQQLARVQARWPEWPLPYVMQGIVLESQHQAAEAKQALETAIALGSEDPAAYYHLALAIKDLTPGDNSNAYEIISRGLKLDPEDPYMQFQAAKIAMDMKDYPVALGHLQEAIRLYPEMADAHWLLANLYRITGENDKQRIELAEVQRLNKLFPPGTQTPPSMQDLLFSVRKPRLAGGQGSTVVPDR